MGIIEMYAEMEKAISEQMMNDCLDELQAIYDKEDAEEDARLKEEYEVFFEENYARKDKGNTRYSRRNKDNRITKADRKAQMECRFTNRHGVCDNGHYFIAPTNCRGAYTITLIEKKANRKRKHTLADDIAEYEQYLATEIEEMEVEETKRTIEPGYYYVLCDAKYYDSCIVPSDPYVILACHFGNGEWDTELLEGENYKVIPINFPQIEDFQEV